MDWIDAVMRSPERVAYISTGDYVYMKYMNGSVFRASNGDFKIKEKYHGHIDGDWKPLIDEKWLREK